MVYINDQKFACESCIKGHRSSSCTHNDRPLFEVKKKGRPVSQCEKCRELRKTRRMHSKCICGAEKEEKAVRPLHATSKRFIAIVPSLPNGLKDALPKDIGPLPQADPRARVDGLLNPCHCKDVWSCKCAPVASGSGSSAGSGSVNGLDTLVLAAASLDCSSTLSSDDPIRDHCEESSCVPQKHPRDNSQPSPKRRSKRLHCCSSPEKQELESQRGPVLPPILSVPFSDPTTPPPLPEFPAIPPLSSIVELAGSGCTCGFDCTCPGCTEHRGSSHVSKDHSDCPDGCSTCVDHSHALELPSSSSLGSASPPSTASSSRQSHTPDFLEAFFAKAASIPPPPPERANARTLDGANVTVYPVALFAGETRTLDERGPAFGLIRLPKLECCAGRCGCPGDSCGCGEACDGCCAHHDGGPALAPVSGEVEAAAVAEAKSVAEVEVEAEVVPDEVDDSPPAEVRSCCCGS